MAYLSIEQQKTLLNNAPAGLDKSKIIKSWVDQGIELEGFQQKQEQNQSTIGNFLKNTASDIKKRGQNVEASISDTSGNPIVRGFGATAEGFGAILDTAGNAARAIVGDKPVDTAKEILKKGFDVATNKLSETKLIKEAAQYPEQTMGIENALKIASSAGEIAGTIDAASGVATAGNKIASFSKKTIKDIEKNVATLTKQSEDTINSSVLSNYQKGVKPSLAGKKTTGQVSKYKNDVVDAVNAIQQNAPNLSYIDETGSTVVGQTPKTLQQFSDAIDQTKKSIFQKYDELAQKAGDTNAVVDLKPIADELDSIITNKALAISNPSAIKYAENLKERLISSNSLDFKTAQDVVQNYNKSLEAFYRNPNYDTASQAAVDSMVANNIRKSLDSGIENITGEQYSMLKKQYGSLKAIESDVLKAALRDAKRNTKGLIDFTDIFSGGQVVNGLLNLNPGQVGSGLAQKAITEIYKYLNNPNRAIENMFKNQPLISDSLSQTNAATINKINPISDTVPQTEIK